jgi:hypothetical protein
MIPEDFSISSLPKVPKSANNNQRSCIAKRRSIPQVSNPCTGEHVNMKSGNRGPKGLGKGAVKEQVLGGFRHRAERARV